jgi:hypothetical protein
MKRTLIHCGSRSKFNRIMQYLTEHSFLKKRGRTGGRAPYIITENGLKQLAVLKNNT